MVWSLPASDASWDDGLRSSHLVVACLSDGRRVATRRVVATCFRSSTSFFYFGLSLFLLTVMFNATLVRRFRRAMLLLVILMAPAIAHLIPI